MVHYFLRPEVLQGRRLEEKIERDRVAVEDDLQLVVYFFSDDSGRLLNDFELLVLDASVGQQFVGFLLELHQLWKLVLVVLEEVVADLVGEAVAAQLQQIDLVED